MSSTTATPPAIDVSSSPARAVQSQRPHVHHQTVALLRGPRSRASASRRRAPSGTAARAPANSSDGKASSTSCPSRPVRGGVHALERLARGQHEAQVAIEHQESALGQLAQSRRGGLIGARDQRTGFERLSRIEGDTSIPSAITAVYLTADRASEQLLDSAGRRLAHGGSLLRGGRTCPGPARCACPCRAPRSTSSPRRSARSEHVEVLLDPLGRHRLGDHHGCRSAGCQRITTCPAVFGVRLSDLQDRWVLERLCPARAGSTPR